MTTQKNVGWVPSFWDERPGAVTHQDHETGHHAWPVRRIEEVTDVNPRVDKSAIPNNLPVSFVPTPAVGAGDGSILGYSSKHQVPHAMTEALATAFELGQRPVLGSRGIQVGAGAVRVALCLGHNRQHMLGVVLPVGRHV